MGLLLGHYCETTRLAVASLRPARNTGSTVGGGVFYVVRPEVITRDRPSSVQFE
jgi:hypothetical protein